MFEYCVCICVHCVHICVCAGTCTRVCLWKPLVNVGSHPWLLTIVVFEMESLAELVAH